MKKKSFLLLKFCNQFVKFSFIGIINNFLTSLFNSFWRPSALFSDVCRCRIEVKSVFARATARISFCLVLLGPKDCFSLGSPQGEGSSPRPDSFLTGASAPVRGIYWTTLGLTANLRGPFPADAPLRPSY